MRLKRKRRARRLDTHDIIYHLNSRLVLDTFYTTEDQSTREQ